MTKGSALTPDWTPSSKEIDYGVNLGFTVREVREVAEDMRLWAQANAHRPITQKSNWHRAFLGWMRRAAKRRGMWPSRHEKSYAGLADV